MIKVYIFLWVVLLSLSVGVHAQQTDSIDQKQQLDELVVKGRKEIVRNEGPRTIVTISGTPYANYDNAAMMMENLPGMAPSPAGTTVIGAGVPVYYVNGREIKNFLEIKAIEPSNIKTVEINRLPGVEYGVGVPAVVLITLKKSINDYVNLKVGASATQRRRFSDNLYMTSSLKYKNFSTSLNVDYSDWRSELKESYIRNVYDNDKVSTYTQSRDLQNYNSGPAINYIAEYKLGERSLLGLYYSFNHEKDKSTPFGTNSISTPELQQSWKYEESGNKIANNHNFTLMWEWSNSAVNLRITQDVFLKYSRGRSVASEIDFADGRQTDTWSFTNSRYHTYTTNAKLTLNKLPWEMSGGTGVRYDRVNSLAGSAVSAEDIDYESDMHVNEDNIKVYLYLQKRIGRFYILPQVTYTYTHRMIDSKSGADAGYGLKQRYSYFSPLLYVQWQPVSDVTIYCQYSRRIAQPGFRALNSGMIYENRWEWSDGNPELEATVSDYGWLGISWKSLSFLMRYGRTMHGISEWESQMSQGSDAIVRRNVNLSRYSCWTADLSYSGHIGPVNYYVSLSGALPRYRMLVKGKEELCNKPNFDANVNLSYQLNKHFSFTTSYTWSGQHHQVQLRHFHSWQKWRIGMQVSLLDDRMKVYLNVDDILKTANYSNNSTWYNNINNIVTGRSDSRFVQIGISYVIFNKKIGINTEQGNDEIRSRIY